MSLWKVNDIEGVVAFYFPLARRRNLFIFDRPQSTLTIDQQSRLTFDLQPTADPFPTRHGQMNVDGSAEEFTLIHALGRQEITRVAVSSSLDSAQKYIACPLESARERRRAPERFSLSSTHQPPKCCYLKNGRRPPHVTDRSVITVKQG